MTDGTLAVRRRDPKTSETTELEAKQSALASGSYEYFAEMETIFGTGHIKKKGKDLPTVVGAVDEVKIESRRREKLKAFDRYLKAFKYSAALDSSIKKVRPPLLVNHLLAGAEPPERPTVHHFCTHPRAHSSGWSPSGPIWAGRCNTRAGSHILA